MTQQAEIFKRIPLAKMGALKFSFSQMVALRNFLDLGLFASGVRPKSFSSGMEREKIYWFLFYSL